MASQELRPSFGGHERVAPRPPVAARSRLPGLLVLLGGLVFLLILPSSFSMLLPEAVPGRKPKSRFRN